MTMRERQRQVQLCRGQIPSPGRPTVAWREDRVRFWAAIGRGASSEDAAREIGVSQAVGTRWFRQAGGVAPKLPPAVPGRFLSFAEREDIAIWHAQKVGVREIARRLGRSPSTISRELRRNASTRTWRLDFGGAPTHRVHAGPTRYPCCRGADRPCYYNALQSSTLDSVREILWMERAEDHIAAHHVTPDEVEQVVSTRPRLVLTGREGTEYVFGTTAAGRYLLVVLIEALDGRSYVVTARDMNDAERQAFQRKGR